MLRTIQILFPGMAAGLLALHVFLPRLQVDTAPVLLLRLAALGLCLSLGIAALDVVVHGRMLLPDEAPLEATAAALTTWIGQVVAVQATLAALALVSLLFRGDPRIALILACLAAATGALRGHVIAAGEAGPLGIVSVLHVSLASLWVGGLTALTACGLLVVQGRTDRRGWRTALQAFSPWALRGMLVLLATGVLLAERTVASGAALLATPYGQTVLAKLILIGAALWCASRLRRWLADPSVFSDRRAGTWLALEAAFALTIVVIAGFVASTIPAAHDSIVWPLPFRIAPTAAWLLKGPGEIWPALLAPAVVSATALAAWRFRKRGALRAGAIILAGLFVGAAMAVPALSVNAYPTTYLHSPIAYSAASVAEGARLYRQWCADCHGISARGNGRLADKLPARPANLTEPHVQWHTHGDIFWWLTVGIPAAGMPGFQDRLADEERWHLLNFLTALSLGHEARPVTRTIAPRDPWLPAIDLSYIEPTGAFESLSGLRKQERPVILGFADNDAQLQRLETLAGVVGHADVVAIAVLSPNASPARGPAGWHSIVDASGDIGAAWSLYRRTLDDPDFDNERDAAAGLLFLIDRFGFVRARWTAAMAPPSAGEVAALVAQLGHEPRLRTAEIHGSR
jgi:putative copper export protein/mono/diheme cytochrome c family protein